MSDANLEERVRSVDHVHLTDMVRQATGQPGLEIQTWNFSPLDGGLGLSTGGLFRFVGIGRGLGERAPWSLVLKVLRPVPDGYLIVGTGMVPPPGWGCNPTHCQYWKREALVYQSGILSELPVSIRPPRCFSVEENSLPEAWIWLEDLVDRLGPRWPLARFKTAAYHLGIFNGISRVSHPIHKAKWLNTDFIRRSLIDRFAPEIELVRLQSTWDHPVVRWMFPVPVAARLERLYAEREELLAVVDQLPSTLCHFDAQRRNLFSRLSDAGQECTTVIDWEYLGLGALGQDLVALVIISTLLGESDIATIADLDRYAFEAYLEGLAAAGWSGDPRVVRFAYAASGSLYMAAVAPELMRVTAMTQSDLESPDEMQATTNWLTEKAALTYWLLGLADEARSLLHAI